jgi:nitroimidazol reductase NimA-like FMN-containing flavoprotein (pyridoxamine 5'-phosphate oxidase superfamily)
MNWNTKIKDALDRTEFMSLSTIDTEGVWSYPVAFSYDEKCNLYFLSRLSARHTQNIVRDQRASVNIYKTERTNHDGVIGLQARGTAQMVKEPAELAECIGLYFSRSVVGEEYRQEAVSATEPDGDWHVFKIALSELWYFNSNEFDTTSRVSIDLDALDVPAPQ